MGGGGLSLVPFPFRGLGVGISGTRSLPEGGYVQADGYAPPPDSLAPPSEESRIHHSSIHANKDMKTAN